MILLLALYFLLLFAVSKLTAKTDSNSAFYRGEKKSSWLMVAYGMIGASVSGVSFVSVPGMVITQDMTYLQTCFGFILGYFIVAFVLLPVFYKLNTTSIYETIGNQRIAALLYFVSDMLGSAVKFFLVCSMLQIFIFDELGVPFVATVPLLVLCIWLYTKTGGVRTLVFTDVLQTTCMLAALIGLLWSAGTWIAENGSEPWSAAVRESQILALHSPHLRVVEFSDFKSTQNFWKQFFSGAFIVVVMTGLNQNMMQKNLTCRTLKESQKNMSLCGFFFVPVNFLFLILGVMLTIWVENGSDPLALQGGMPKGDDLLPMYIQASNLLWVKILFVLGIISAAFSSADSALTGLTTSFCVDIMRKPEDETLRKRIHLLMAVAFIGVVFLIKAIGSGSLLDLVYVLVSYTYGPLLGLFAFNLLYKKTTLPGIPTLLICIAAPVLCYLLNQFTVAEYDYKFGYELLLLNGFLTFIGINSLNLLAKSKKI